MNPDQTLKNSGWIPFPVKKIQLKDILIPDNESTIPDGKYTKLGVRSHFNGTFHKDYILPSNKNKKLYLVKANRLIVNVSFAWEGAVAITKLEYEGTYVSRRFPQYQFAENQLPSY